MAGKFFWLKSHLNGLCLDVEYGQAQAGNHVITWEYGDADNQLWYEDRVNSVIRSKLDDSLVLEENDDDYMIVNTYDPDNHKQKWLTSVNRVCRKGKPNKVIAIRKKNPDHGAKCKAKDFDDEDHQKWDMEYTDPVYCAICTADEEKGLDITGCNSDPGAQVIVWSRHSDVNQQWYEDKHGVIRSRLNDFAIDTSDGLAQMQEYEAGKDSQEWVRSGDTIVNRHDHDLCLQYNPDTDSPEVQVESAPYDDQENQKWKFIYL